MSTQKKQLLSKLKSHDKLLKKIPASSSEDGKKGNDEKNVNSGHRTGFQLTVGRKLFVIIFCSVLIPVLIAGSISLSVTKRIIEENSSQAAHETIQQTSEKIDATFTTYEFTMNQFITNLNLHQYLFEATERNREAYVRLNAQRMIGDALNQVAYGADTKINTIAIIGVNPDHGIYNTGNTTLNSADFDREAEWFQRIVEADGSVWLHTKMGGYLGVHPGKASFAVGKMFRSSYNQRYVVFIEIDQSLINDLVDDIKLSDSSKVYVTDGQNKLLHGHDLAVIGSEAELPLPSENRVTAKAENGETHIVVKHYSDMVDWYVVGTAPIAELTADTQVISQANTIIMIVAAALAILLSLVVSRSMGNPLRRLQRLMNEGAKGNLNVRTNFRNRDEIGQVGESFNDMMEQISQLVSQTNDSAAEVLNTAQELTVASKDTAHAAREISEATEQIANGASTLAMEAERGNELVIDLSKQLAQVVEANRMMGEVAADVHRVSEQGTGYMGQLTEKTQSTEEMTRRMVEKVDQLKESTASIRNLLVMLTQITQQTNILALNASIEASRSGAAGRGFMVIAGEIRKLADESRKSIDVVADMIEDIQTGIDETVTVMQEAYPLFQEQIDAVMDADKIFNDVRDRMIGLVQQADEVTEAIEQLEKVQQVLSDTMASVSAVSEESSAISEEVASSSASQLHTSESLVRLANNLEQLSQALSESLKKFKF